MRNTFTPIKPEAIKDNVFKLISTDWMLVSAGTLTSYNTLTASWGGMGHLWRRDVCFCFIRPSRHTFGFMEKNRFFSLCFFEEKFRDVLNYCGTRSGRDTDKAGDTGITPVATENGTVFFNEARMVIECEKIYYHDVDPGKFLLKEIDALYPQKDYSRMYIGEVKGCRVKK